MAAFISTGEGKSGRRALDHSLPLIPIIDFMICLIAFLIVTAVWTQASRIEATGRAPGGDPGPPPNAVKELHVVASNERFELRWQQGATVLETRQVARTPVSVGEEQRYPALTQAITEEWQAQGQHRDPSDRQLDHAVIHVPNHVAFDEIVAVLDSLHAPRRGKASAFEVAFASN
jgi:biopolymer transport protein ExbD